MSEVGFEIIKTKEVEESEIKYLNINVSNSEVERNPNIVRLCSDVGMLEYVKPKTGRWIIDKQRIRSQANDISVYDYDVHCDNCGYAWAYTTDDVNSLVSNYCPNCGARMVEPQESEE